MIETQNPGLPPGLEGETQYILTLTIDEILWELESQAVQVKVEWWGQKRDEAQIFTPVDVENFTKSKIGDVLFVRYEVRTSSTKFTEYLLDASPLKVDVVTQNEQVVGSSLVQNLERITENACGFEGYFPVVNNDTKEVIANLRIHFLLQSLADFQSKSVKESNLPQTKKTIKSRPRSSTKSSTKPQTKQSILKSRSRVQFSDKKSENQSKDVQEASSRHQRSEREAGPRAPLADSIVSELLNQSQELRKSMQEKLATNFGPGNSETSKHTKSGLGEPRTIPREVVPSWNLPVERMRVLACVSRLEVSIASVQISPVILDKLLQKDSRSKPRDSGSFSFFVKYKLPSDSDETSHCTRKLKGNFAEFNEKRTIPITFTSDTLEEWWNYKTDFKIFSRHLGQRVPLLLGEASLGMKYLLLHDRYTGGAPLSLPVYVSNSLFREIKLPTDSSEIVGNIHLAVQLSYRDNIKSRHGSEKTCNRNNDNNIEPSTKFTHNKTEAETEVGTNGSDERLHSKTETEVRVPHTRPTSSQKGKITINSRPHKDTLPTFEQTVYLEMRVSIVDPADQFLIKHRNLDLCEGKISEGENLVVTSILFMPGQQGTIHNRLMLSRLSQNYLILQVWRNDQLIGISKVETEPIHTAFQNGEIQDDKCLIFYDGNIDVVDIFDGQTVAELKLRVRVGSDQYINPPDLITTSLLCQKESGSSVDDHQHRDFSSTSHGQIDDNPHHNAEKTFDNSRSVQTSFLDCDNSRRENDEKVKESENLMEDENSDDYVLMEILIEEARNLPYLRNKGENIVPKVYVTLFEHSSHMSTPIKESTCPLWNHRVQIKLDSQYIYNPRKFLILKVWHHHGDNVTESTDSDKDQVIGYVAVDLTPLSLASFPYLCGWYNISDWVGKCRGQIKLTVTPLQAVTRTQHCTDEVQEEFQDYGQCDSHLKKFSATGKYKSYPAHLVPHKELLIRSTSRSSPDLSLVSETSQNQHHWQEPYIKPTSGDGTSISVLEKELYTHLEDLNNLTKSLLHSNDQFNESRISNDGSNKTFTIDEANQNDSVILVQPKPDELPNSEQALKKNLETLKNFMKQGTALVEGSGRSSRTSLLSDELPRDDQPDLMDLGLVLEDLEQILDMDTDRSKNGPDSNHHK